MNLKDPSWVGERFRKLTVTKILPSAGRGTRWVCQCDCGNTITTLASRVTSGHVVSCGCAFKSRRHGMVYDENNKVNRLYTVWVSMRARCYNPNDSGYHNYGGRGIGVCDEWDSYPTFYKWAMENGYDPHAPHMACTLDRIDVDGDYCPENCRWADPVTQAKNKRKTPRHAENAERMKQIIDIFQMRLDGCSYKEIAEKHNLTVQAVKNCLATKKARIRPPE